DGLLELALLSTFTGQWREQAGNRFVADTGTNYNCNRNQFAVLVDFTGDDALEVICVSNGGDWVRRAWDGSTRPFTNVDARLPNVQAVNDVVIGDFDNNGRNDMLLLKGALRPSQAVQYSKPDKNAWGVEALMVNRSRMFSFRTSGTLKVRLDWNRTFKN